MFTITNSWKFLSFTNTRRNSLVFCLSSHTSHPEALNSPFTRMSLISMLSKSSIAFSPPLTVASPSTPAIAFPNSILPINDRNTESLPSINLIGASRTSAYRRVTCGASTLSGSLANSVNASNASSG